MRRLGSLMVRALVGVFGLAAVLALLGLAVGPHLLGYRTVTMLSSSMRPTVNRGDVVVIRAEPAADVRPGQLLTFAAPVAGRPVLTHRIVSVDRRPDDVVVRTKGDANPAADPWLARLEGAVAWHAVAVVPAVGSLISALHRPAVRVLSVWLIPSWLCAEALMALWRRRPEADAEPAVAAGKDLAETAR